MSTFDGHIKEFPSIRIDYFRPSPEDTQPALAYFLSHIHSDHLVGLESCKSPFIYCSPATRDLLLRLEKYPHRMNFAKGILETRRQTYGHLRKLLKAIPLETPTVIELRPGERVRVSLFEANHCPGAVGFLIEGDGKAVFYSGDMRAEEWWVRGLVRNSLMLRFTGVGGKRLDCLYLDTTFARVGKRYAEFPSKEEGLRELVGKLAGYPKDAMFYYDAWTFGYEDVWQTLSTVLDTQVHLDDYRYGLYRALANGAEPKAPEAAKLMGFRCGNHDQEGCVTDRQTRLHSCEYGTGCPVWNHDFVRITPIISRYRGVEMREAGAGGGKGDLNPKHELELGDVEMMGKLIEAYEEKLNNPNVSLSRIWSTIGSTIAKGAQSLSLDFGALGLHSDGENDSHMDDLDPLENLPLDKLLPALATWLEERRPHDSSDQRSKAQISSGEKAPANTLPKQITFPYSRHSSYKELCDLVSALNPRDIHPCTVDSANYDPSANSMEALFGHLYDEGDEVSFSYDEVMREKVERREELEPWRPYRKRRRRSNSPLAQENSGQDESQDLATGEYYTPIGRSETMTQTPVEGNKVLSPGEVSLAWRREVYDSALGARGRSWGDVEMVSVAGHQAREVEM